MKQTWTDTHFGLRSDNQPVICTHREEVVTLSMPGYMLDGQGFSIVFTHAHLGMAQRLVAALAALPPRPSESEPFAD